jgi:hypothetical protein
MFLVEKKIRREILNFLARRPSLSALEPFQSQIGIIQSGKLFAAGIFLSVDWLPGWLPETVTDGRIVLAALVPADRLPGH